MLATEQLWEFAQFLITLLGAFGITIAVAVGAAWAAFKWFGQRWIENKFSRAIEHYRAEQAQELEKLKHRINSAFDRLTRQHDREFEVLPDLWAKLVDARMWASEYVSSFQRTANIDLLTDEALEEFLRDKPFMDWQKREIMEAGDRQKKFDETNNRYRHHDVVKKLAEFDLAFAKNGIFLPPDLEELMRKLSEMIAAAVLEQNFNLQFDRHHKRDSITALEQDGASLHLQIKKLVTQRLFGLENITN